MKRVTALLPQPTEGGRKKMHDSLARLDAVMARRAAINEPPSLVSQLAIWRVKMALTSVKVSQAIRKARGR